MSETFVRVLRNIALWLPIIAGAVVLVGWNSSRFLGAKPEIRAKNLDFLPAPETARILALGHANTLAKLRWIDSFAYFQYQLDHKDDRVLGGGSGFERLYQTLIELDPKFEPFYEHAALNLSGILTNHGAALAFLSRGNLELADSTSLWRNTISTLKVFFTLDQRQPLQFDAMLSAWELAESDPDAKRLVWDWKKKFGSDTFSGLEQLPYWMTQLDLTSPGTPSGDYVEGALRDLLARYGSHELSELLASWRIAQGGVPATRHQLIANLDLISPLAPLREPGLSTVNSLLDPRLIRRRYPHGLPSFGPISTQGVKLALRSDPYGLPWRVKDGEVISPGLLRARIEQRVAGLTGALLDLAQQRGFWPKTLEEVRQWGLALPVLPEEGEFHLDGHQVVVTWAVEPGPPWPLRQGTK